MTNLDTAVFTAYDGVPANNPTGGYTVTLGAAQSVAGIVIGSATAPGNDGQLTLTGTGSPGLTLGAGGLTLNGSTGDPTLSANLGTVTLAADQTWTVNNAHVWTINSAIAGNATVGNTRTFTLGYVNAFTNVYSGIISNGAGGGELALTVNNTNGLTTGGGTQSITGNASTYTGKTSVLRGLLQITSLKDLGVASSLGAPTTVANGTIDLGSAANAASLYFQGSAASSSNRVINLAGTFLGATLKNNSAAATSTLTLSGGITNGGGGSKILTLGGTNAGANLISGVISDALDFSTTGVTKTESGFWTLGGANTYTGGTVINAGTLAISPTGTLGQDIVGNNITISGGNLLLNAATNVGSNQAIIVSAAGGGIGVSYDPVSFPTVTDNSGTTGGVFGLNYTGTGGIGSVAGVDALFTSSSFWSLGSFSGGSGTYTGTSLTPGSGSTYRIGGGGGTINFTNNILVGANNVIFGSTGGGIVNTTNANTYTGT
ncbi:MAG: beta strand repeat-containing protein, partial [Bradyrhizobium sp.]